MKNCLYIILVILCSSTKVWGSIYFRHLGKADGLSQLSVMSISQDELGRMWFGTLEGLNCYDGSRITCFKYSKQYPILGNQILNVVNDKNGNLFLTSDKMLLHFDIYKEKFTQLRKEGTNTLFAKNNQVWMATKDTIFKWNNSKHSFQFLLSHGSIRDIKNICIDNQKRLWVGTNNGLYRFNNMLSGSSPTCIIPEIAVNNIFCDSHSNIFVSLNRNGMYKIAPNDLTSYFTKGNNSLSDNDVRSFAEDNFGNIWIATFNGLNKLDHQGHFTYYQRDNLPGTLKHSSIFPIYKDVQGTIWLGTFFGGVQYFNPQTDLFTHYSENINRKDCLSFFFVGKMAEDKHGDIWVCTEGGGLNKLDRKTRQFTHYLADGKPNSIPFNNLKCIAYDEKHDRLYIGTHTKGLFRLDIPTGKIYCYNDYNETGHTIIYMAIHRDKLYFSSGKGLLTLNLETNVISPFLVNQKPLKQVNAFTIDSKNNLWITLLDGLLRTNLNKTKDRHTYRYENKGLGKSPITSIIENKKGQIFLATVGSGLFRYDNVNDSFLNYGTKEGWNQSNYCYEMALSKQGRLIISGEHGISLFDPQRKTTTIFDLENNRYLSSLNEGCGILTCRNGEIFIGSTDGMTSFIENKMFSTPPPHNIYFSSISINSQLVSPNTSNILTAALPFSSKVNLKHNENNLIITFTSNNYIHNLQQSKYEYTLKGFDNRWTECTDNKIIYTNLNPGNYTLVLREKEFGKIIQSTHLEIIIHSPWYATWLAYTIYLLILSIIAYTIIRNGRSKILLKRSLNEEKREKMKNEEIMQAKLQFFSNISHEFRTPLTLIISQIEILLQYKGTSPFVYNRLLKINRNTFQLRELISELLDFRKMEQGAMKLKVIRMNLIPFLKNIHQEFQEQATVQNIEFKFSSDTEELISWCDPKQLRKIVLNLLSNAFKDTPQAGKINLIAEESEHCILIKVIDTGKGIAEEELPHIFDRFYQANNSVSKESGTGIGLALTKGLVDLHHGKIEVCSALNYGSIFTIKLPNRNTFNENNNCLIEVCEQEDTTKESGIHKWKIEAKSEELDELPISKENKKPCIVIVEDNEEMLQTLAEILSPLYHVITAINGKDGLEKIIETNPELIVSDIMMPIMSGIELCMKVKNNFDLCHIPFILLTARTSEENNIEGLQCGADDYITKPFNNKLLVSKIAGILRSRNLLKKKYSNLLTEKGENKTQELALNSIDQKFMEQLNEVIEKHLSDPEFNISAMAKEIGVSRSSLYNKLKGLSCMTPNEFVLNIKLKKAADMLREHPELQITEIAYQLGFNSLRHFRYCFKAQFNQTPQEYKNKKQ